MRAIRNQAVEQGGGSLSSFFAQDWRTLFTALSPLWVGGAALLCLLPAIVLKPVLVEWLDRADVWAMYLLLGTLFPAVVAAILLGDRSGIRVPTSIAAILVTLPIVGSALVAGPQHSLIALGLALLQGAISVLVLKVGNGEVNVTRMLSIVVIGFVAWTVSLAMVWWPDMEAVLAPSPRLFAVGVIALAVTCWWAMANGTVAHGWRRRALWVVDGGCLLIFTLLAFRTDGLGGTDPVVHWGALVSPAEAVRQGGWLLWDVPSQYGFLTTLSLAALPTSSSWQSLYLLNGISSVLVAIFVYVVLRTAWKTVLGALFAAAVTAPVVFLLTAVPARLLPEHHFPSSGPFRFGWSYVLIALLLLERRYQPGSRAQRMVLIAGCLCWLIAVLWSAESAIYNTAIWFPAFGMIVLRDHGGFGGARDWKRMLSWLMAPPLLLAGAFGVILVLYRQLLGHGPDLRAYVDVALSFSGSFVLDSLGHGGPTEPPPAIIAVFFGFLLLALAAAAIALTRTGRQDLPIMIGLAFGVWAHSSYPVGLPSPNTVFRLMPFLVLGLGIVVAVIAPRYLAQPNHSWVDLVKAGTIPLLTGLLVMTYANGAQLQANADAIRGEAFHGRDVTAGFPSVDPSLSSLLQAAGVNASDPIFFSGATPLIWIPAGQSAPVVASKPWRAASLIVLAVLPDDRKQIYLDRGDDRHVAGGWLIEPRRAIHPEGSILSIDPWFFDHLATSHTPTKIAQNEDWRLVWYEPVADAPGRPLASGHQGRVPALPRTLAINGEPLARSVLPPVWGYLGPEWIGDRASLCASGRGTLAVFTPAPLKGRIVLIPAQNSAFGETVRVMVNEATMVDARIVPNGNAQAPVSLAEGWNTVSIQLAATESPRAEEAESVSCGATDSTDSSLVIQRVSLMVQ